MAFISNQERQKRIKKLNSGNGFRKFIIILTYIFSAICVVFVLLIAIAGLSYYSDYDHWGKDIVQALIIDYPEYAIVVACFTLFLILVSVILTFTMKSSKKITSEAVKLASIPVGGKKTKSHTADIKRRITIEKK